MPRIPALVVVGVFATLTASAQPAADLTLARLDCGTGVNDQRRFSGTFAYSNPQVPFTFSCYVIKHGNDYMSGTPATRRARTRAHPRSRCSTSSRSSRSGPNR